MSTLPLSPLSPSALPLSSLATASVCALAGAALGRLLQSQPPRRPCHRCDGSGYVDCVCTRWSAMSNGCGSCSGSLKQKCPSCGGGGSGVPGLVPIPVRVRDGFRGIVAVTAGTGLVEGTELVPGERRRKPRQCRKRERHRGTTKDT